MTYLITKTDGSILTQVADGVLDQTTTDITLIGKNSSGYGNYIDNNFVHILENFANVSQPIHPITGQLWFDTTENRLKVYDGTVFKVSGGTIISTSVPSGITAGDLWIDSTRQQLYFNDGTSTKLAGPIYTASQGITGFSTEDILDTNSISHTILKLTVAQTLIGIFSKDNFTPATLIAGFSGNITIGFNAGTYSGIKFNTPTTQADYLLAPDGSRKTSANFLSTTDSSSTTGTITIQNTTPLVLGVGANTEIDTTSTLFQIKSNTVNQNVGINTLNNSGLQNSLYINSANKFVGIYTNTPTSTLDVNGDVTVEGNLTVKGSTLTVSTTVINISDKFITLGKVANPNNSTADGGGFTIAGGNDTDKQFLWQLNNLSFNSSENVNLTAGKSFKIGGFEVLTQTQLGTTITSAPGLVSVGTLAGVGVSYMSIGGTGTESTIAYTNTNQANGTIYLTAKGTGSIDVTNFKITNVATPINTTDAANKSYVDTAISKAPLAISLTTTGLTNPQIAGNYLSKVFPSSEHPDNTIVRAVCTDGGTTTVRQFQLLAGTWAYQTQL
jgi:hypothetical protein